MQSPQGKLAKHTSKASQRTPQRSRKVMYSCALRLRNLCKSTPQRHLKGHLKHTSRLCTSMRFAKESLQKRTSKAPQRTPQRHKNVMYECALHLGSCFYSWANCKPCQHLTTAAVHELASILAFTAGPAAHRASTSPWPLCTC